MKRKVSNSTEPNTRKSDKNNSSLTAHLQFEQSAFLHSCYHLKFPNVYVQLALDRKMKNHVLEHVYSSFFGQRSILNYSSFKKFNQNLLNDQSKTFYIKQISNITKPENITNVSENLFIQ